MKNCKECKKEFSPMPNSPGMEQLYCSPTCRNKAANDRRLQKLKENIINNYEKEIPYEKPNPPIFNNTGGYQNQRQQLVGGNFDSYFNLLESKYETKSECNYQKLKIDYLEKELRELKDENLSLTIELDELENDKIGKAEESPMSNIMKMATPYIFELLTKKNTNAKTTPPPGNSKSV